MKIKLFAYLGEELGSEISLSLSEPMTKASVLQEVSEKYPMMASDILLCNVAINQQYLTLKDHFLIEEVQEVALIPPVSGG